jgi:hypothetical protein
MAVCESKRLISTVTDIKFVLDGKNVSILPSIKIKNDESSVPYMSYIYVMISHLTVRMWGIFLTEHPSKHILRTVLLSQAINFLQLP